MERLLTGLVDFSIKKVLTWRPVRLEAVYKRETPCPECGSFEKRIKASFWREIKSIPLQGRPVILRVHCHKFHCKQCGRYFNTRMNGIKKWNRSTEPLKNNIFIPVAEDILIEMQHQRAVSVLAQWKDFTIRWFYRKTATGRTAYAQESLG